MISEIDAQIELLKKQKTKEIQDMINDGIAKIVYCIEGGDGHYGWIKGNLIVVSSKDQTFLQNLKFIRMFSDDEEGNTYNPVAFDNEYLDKPDDMELHFNFGYILNKNIVPVLPYGEKFLNEIEKLNQIRNSWSKNK